MQPCAILLGLALALSASVASAKDLCIQLDDDGDVLVLKGVGKGAKALTAYVAEYAGGGSFNPRPATGASVMESNGSFAAALTQYGVGINSFTERITFHRVRCNPGSDQKLGVLDSCQDITMEQQFDSFEQDSHPAHVINCIPEIAIE